MTQHSKMRSTRQRAAVEECLASLPRFASAADIHRHIIDSGTAVGLTTVYRTLQRLADAGEVDIIHGLGSETLYRKCDNESHHHHLVCTQCGATEEVPAQAVENWAKRTAKEYGYVGTGHTAEIFGVCPNCQKRG